MLAFYLLLALAFWTVATRRPGRRWLFGGLGGLLALGTVLTVWPGRPDVPLEVHVLAVDHGGAILLRSAEGRDVLYDCGKMRDPHAGRRVIAPALWRSACGGWMRSCSAMRIATISTRLPM